MCSASEDNRLCCSINLDGGDFICQTNSLTKPYLMLLEEPEYSDEDLLKKGRDAKNGVQTVLIGQDHL